MKQILIAIIGLALAGITQAQEPTPPDNANVPGQADNPPGADETSVGLGWDKNPEGNVIGYRIYAAKKPVEAGEPPVYAVIKEVLNDTEEPRTHVNLKNGETWLVYLTAINRVMESLPSNTIEQDFTPATSPTGTRFIFPNEIHFKLSIVPNP